MDVSTIISLTANAKLSLRLKLFIPAKTLCCRSSIPNVIDSQNALVSRSFNKSKVSTASCHLSLTEPEHYMALLQIPTVNTLLNSIHGTSVKFGWRPKEIDFWPFLHVLSVLRLPFSLLLSVDILFSLRLRNLNNLQWSSSQI